MFEIYGEYISVCERGDLNSRAMMSLTKIKKGQYFWAFEGIASITFFNLIET